MDEPTLQSLEEIEANETASTQTGFTLAIVERELVLICSLILRAPEQVLGHIEGEYVHPETATDRYNRLWRSYFTHSDARNRAFLHRLPDPYLGEEQLPDVCGRCFRTVGFCASGRIRINCQDCYNQDKKAPNSLVPISRSFYPYRICSDSRLIEAIFAQLIYKYYSQNGDRSWQMKSLIS